MRKVTLHNGQIIEFPDNTPDSIIQGTVKRILGKENKDFFGQAIDKQINTIKELKINEVVRDCSDKIGHFNSSLNDVLNNISSVSVTSNHKNKEDIISSFESISNDVISHLGILAKIETDIMRYTAELNESLNKMMLSQVKTNEILKDLVGVMKSKKKVIRDKDGNITGIEQ